jgi:hypothetical protein
MSIQLDLDELNLLDEDIKRRKRELIELRTQRENVERRIISFLKEKDQPGVKYRGKAVLIDVKQRSQRKKKREKEHDMMTVLENYGVSHPQNALKDILNVQKGYQKTDEILRILTKK